MAFNLKYQHIQYTSKFNNDTTIYAFKNKFEQGMLQFRYELCDYKNTSKIYDSLGSVPTTYSLKFKCSLIYFF